MTRISRSLKYIYTLQKLNRSVFNGLDVRVIHRLDIIKNRYCPGYSMVIIRDFFNGEKRILELRIGGGIERNYPGIIFELEYYKLKLVLFCQIEIFIQRYNKRFYILSFRAKRATQIIKKNNKNK